MAAVTTERARLGRSSSDELIGRTAGAQPARVIHPSSEGEVALLGCLDRLDTVLDEERAALRDVSPAEIRALNLRKSAVLLELDRGMRFMRAPEMSPDLIERLRRVRVKLEINLQSISLHLSAVNKIMNVIRKTAECNDADGTYTRTIQWDEWKC